MNLTKSTGLSKPNEIEEPTQTPQWGQTKAARRAKPNQLSRRANSNHHGTPSEHLRKVLDYYILFDMFFYIRSLLTLPYILVLTQRFAFVVIAKQTGMLAVASTGTELGVFFDF